MTSKPSWWRLSIINALWLTLMLVLFVASIKLWIDHTTATREVEVERLYHEAAKIEAAAKDRHDLFEPSESEHDVLGDDN